MSDRTAIQHLARKCARGNLRLAQAVDLFTALYLADAVMLSGGNHTDAAARSGIQRTSLRRRIKTGYGTLMETGEDEP